MKQYLASRTELAFTAEDMIVPFKNDDIFTGSLSELPEWLRQRPFADVPERCVIDGGRHGLFFVLYATHDKMAAAMSAFVGYEVEAFDGVTFASRSACHELATKLKRVGIVVPPSAYRIAITAQAYARDVDKPEQARKEQAEQGDLLPF